MSNIQEIWKSVVGYEGLYEVSNLGKVKSLRYNRTKKPKILKGGNCDGYIKIGLWKNRVKKTDSLHRIVALAFIPNPEKLPQVHHKDHNPLNNVFSNLEWVTSSQNCKYNYTTGGKVGKSNMKGKFGKDNPESKKIKRISPNGQIDIIIGISEAARQVKGSASHIVKVCKGKLNKHKGYKWAYA